ncbi:glycosyltransferase family 2 protein [Candidatus Woesearchaeota archaeon]|nr:glycosyltransferase family 2 protein [Candidatus Woesearchaeota archaeon]
MKAFIIIPSYNEETHIEGVLKKTKKYAKSSQIVVVDDGSRDSTAKRAEGQKVVVLKHAVNMGKGAAMKTGCEYALKKGADTIVVMDADGQHKPEDIPNLLKALNGKDIVFTYRKFNKNQMPFIKRMGNSFIQGVSSFLFNIKVRDTQCGFRAFTKNAYSKIKWAVSDYSVESEMIAKAGKYRLRFAQVPIDTTYHDKYKGVTVIDGIRIFMNMLWWRIGK